MAGLTHIYCGDGKGKTTAALGLAARCAGSGRRVLLAQFLKDGRSPEFAALAHVPGLETLPQTRVFGFTWTLTPEEREEAKGYYGALLEEAFEECSDGGGFFRGGPVGRTLCGDSKKRDGRSSFFTRRWQGL